MYGIHISELLILLVIGGLVLAPIVGVVVLVVFGVKALRGVRPGHTTLNCPHCGAETPAGEGTCRKCGKPFA